MKKNISINISGIIFHIEEDGYDKLKDYLETIHKYFSTYDDSSEITADIENRIAEIFLGKLKEGKQVITLEDVDALIATMGGIKDFKEVEMEEETEPAKSQGQESHEQKSGSAAYVPPRKLYRDEKRKILGGVIAGISHHFDIDPLWIRLAFIIMFFGVSILPAIPVILIITYAVLWIIVPGSYDIPDDRKFKKMYRNPDDKVLGGVASGIGAYFGVDVVIIRLLFIILLFFGGTGLILYIIFWIILPEATTITDKMEMQGEPVTLRNIETNIKKSLRVGEDQEESIWVKILLFPFRLIASVIEVVAKAIGPFLGFLVEAIRVAFGLIMVLIAMGVILSLFIAGGIGLGIFSGAEPFFISDLPLNVITRGIPALPFIAGFFGLLIPSIFLVILGISVIGKRLMLNARIGWGLFALWIISLVVMAVTIPRIVVDFSREGNVVEVENYDFGHKTIVLKMQEAGYENFDRVSLKIRGQDEPGVRLEKRYYARGSSRSDAMENAKMIAYNVVRNDSILTFDSNFSFRPGASFRGQSLDMTLYIPYNEPFKMSDDLRYILRSTIYSSGYSTSDMEGNTWMFTRESGLKCTSCPAVKSEEHHETGIFDMSGYNREIPVHSFSSINADGLFKINVVKDSETKTVINGRSEDIDNIMVKNEGDELDINYKNKLTHWDRNRDEITINISVPSLDHVKFSGATKATLKGFDTDHMEMELSGASTAEADLDVRTLRVKIDGASNLTLNGEGENLILSVEGASGVDAFEYEVKNGDLKVSGASSARVNVTENLDANTSGFGKIRYKGEPNEVNVHGSGSGISKED